MTRGRIDANQPEIVAALIRVGAVPTSLADMGKGVPDLLVSYRGTWLIFEVKDGSKPPSRRKLTADEKRWQDKQRAHTFIVESVDDALMALATVNRDIVRGSSWRMAMGDEA